MGQSDDGGKPPEIESLSFEQAMGELERIVRGLESGDIALEESIAAYERGMALKKHCEAKLAGAKARIDKITLGPDGSASAEPTEID
jgi:exodeoxyribonuclease VII small subunit